MNMTAYIWGLGAGLPAVVAEYLYRTLPGSWFSHLYIWLPIQLLIGYSIYRLVNSPGVTLLDSLVVFAFCTASFRLFTSIVLLDDTIRTGTWIAFGLVMLANLVKVYWRA